MNSMVREVTKNSMVTLTELQFSKWHLKDSDHEKKRFSGLIKSRSALWPECQVSRLEESWHHSYSEAWWWQLHAVGIFFSCRDWETSQD